MRNTWADLNAHGIFFLCIFMAIQSCQIYGIEKKEILPWDVNISKIDAVFFSNAFQNWANKSSLQNAGEVLFS